MIDLESGSDLGDLDEDLLNIRKKGISEDFFHAIYCRLEISL